MDTYKLTIRVPKGDKGVFYTLKELHKNIDIKKYIVDYINKYYKVVYSNLEDPSSDLLSTDIIIHVQKNEDLKNNVYTYIHSPFGACVIQKDINTNLYNAYTIEPGSGAFGTGNTIDECLKNRQSYSLEKVEESLFNIIDPFIVDEKNHCKFNVKEIYSSNLNKLYHLDNFINLYNNGYKNMFDSITRFCSYSEVFQFSLTHVINCDYVLLNDEILVKAETGTIPISMSSLKGVSINDIITHKANFVADVLNCWCLGTYFKGNLEFVALTKEEVDNFLKLNNVENYILKVYCSFYGVNKYTRVASPTSQDFFIPTKDDMKYLLINNGFDSIIPSCVTDAYVTKHTLTA